MLLLVYQTVHSNVTRGPHSLTTTTTAGLIGGALVSRRSGHCPPALITCSYNEGLGHCDARDCAPMSRVNDTGLNSQIQSKKSGYLFHHKDAPS